MSGEQTRSNTPLLIAVIVLALICAAGGILLLTGPQPEPEQPESEAEVLPETTASAVQTTASAVPEPLQTTVTAVTADPHAFYRLYLDGALLPEYGRADTAAAVPCSAHSGIAGAFFADLRDTGTDDMVVIRLDVTDGGRAALPVLLWYGTEADEVTLLDTFEVKPQWSSYCIRRAEKSLYLSGEYLGESGDADTLRFTEIALSFNPAPDLTMLNMEQGTADDRPAPMYPESAELLLEMQLDTAQPISPLTERLYILRDYTNGAAKPYHTEAQLLQDWEAAHPDGES